VHTFLKLLAAIFLFAGCNYPVEIKRNKAQFALFIEEFPQQGAKTMLLKVYQASPKMVHVALKPVLVGGPGMLKETRVVDTQDGLHAIQLNFTVRGQALMEYLTTNYRDRRLYVVVAQSDQSKTNGVNSRCIGASYIRQTLRASSMVFTPDASREESESIVELVNKTLE
jgi:preprotein translocase subunit SecD